MQTDKLASNLYSLGLSAIDTEVYLYLLTHGVQSALQISKRLSKGRTKIYGVLDRLSAQGLVRFLVNEHGTFTFEATSPSNFERLIAEQESHLQAMKQTSSELIGKLLNLQVKQHGKTKAVYYQGVEGLKQITWNSLKAKDTIRIYEIATMSAFMDPVFAEKIRQELVNRKILTKQLINQTQYPAFTQVAAMVNDWWALRYLDPQVVTIRMEMVIYNEVFALYSYEDQEIFGVEIYNPTLAHLQTQIFEVLWGLAQPMQAMNAEGKAQLITGKPEC